MSAVTESGAWMIGGHFAGLVFFAVGALAISVAVACVGVRDRMKAAKR